MSILDVTEEQIFHTLGRGRDPNFKPAKKLMSAAGPERTHPTKHVPGTTQSQEKVEAPVRSAGDPVVDNSIMDITESLCILNDRMNDLQRMVKWYVLPQFMVVVVLLLVLLVKM